MPPIEEHDLHEYAVVWDARSVDDYNRRRVGAPREIDARWSLKTRETISRTGEPLVYDGWLTVADETIGVGAIVWRGSMADLANEGHGTGTGTDDGPDSGLYEVLDVGLTPDLKARFARRNLLLRRYADDLPNVVG